MIARQPSTFLRTIAAFMLLALAAVALPVTPARADGAASTRNIILGGALAAGTLLILNHNKKVHQKEDELTNARNQAQAERDAAYASYQSEAAGAAALRKQLAAANREMAALKREVAQQHSEIMRLRKEVSMTRPATPAQSAFIAPAPSKPALTVPTLRVASVTYGWGQL
jgi:uncharacterized protein HemX